MMIKPDWKPVSELQNMTYEEWKECDESDTVYFLNTIQGVSNKTWFLSQCGYWGASEGEFNSMKNKREHVNFLSDELTFELCDVTHYALFDVAPPEEQQP